MAYRDPDPYDDRDPYDVNPDVNPDPSVDLVDRTDPGGGNRGTDEPTSSTPGTHVGTYTAPPAFGGGTGSRFSDAQQQQYVADATAAGADSAYIASFLQRNPDDWNRLAESLRPTSHRPYDSQTSNPAQQAANATADRFMAPAFSAPGGSGGGGGFQTSGGSTGGAPAFTGQFDDPAASLIEQYALDRFHELQDPNPNSGTAMFEAYLRELTETLKGPVYSDQETSQLKASVYDDIEIQRTQTKQRWLEEVGRRGFPPSSGVALEGLQRIEEQFGTMRTVADRQFATKAIDMRDKRLFQVAEALKGLAGSEEGRQDKALTYATLPKQLSDNAFQQNLQLVGAGGNPGSMLSSALSIYNAVSNNTQIDQKRRDATLEAIFEFITGLD